MITALIACFAALNSAKSTPVKGGLPLPSLRMAPGSAQVDPEPATLGPLPVVVAAKPSTPKPNPAPLKLSDLVDWTAKGQLPAAPSSKPAPNPDPAGLPSVMDEVIVVKKARPLSKSVAGQPGRGATEKYSPMNPMAFSLRPRFEDVPTVKTAPSFAEAMRVIYAAARKLQAQKPAPRPDKTAPAVQRAPSVQEAKPKPDPKPTLKGPVGKSKPETKPDPKPEAVAKTAAPQKPAQKSPEIPEPKPVPGTMADPAVSVDVVELDLAIVLQNLSSQAEVNLVLLSAVQKKITLRLDRVLLSEAVTHICAVAGLKHLKLKTTYVIALEEDLKKAYPIDFEMQHPTKVDLKPEEPKPITKFYEVAFASASQIATLLNSQFEKALKVSVGPGQQVPDLAAGTDTSKVTGVSTGIINDKDGSQTTESSPSARMLVITGNPFAVDQALAIIRQLDTPRPQVAIAVKIIDISNEAMKDLGLSWKYSDLSVTETAPRGINFGSFDRSPAAFTATLAALQKNDRARIVAEPNISVLDTQRAFILIGQRLNFPTLVGYTQANTPIFAPKEERVGIYLQVAATVSPSEEITMSLYPQVSAVTSFLEVNGASYPQISTREAQTTLRVKSGDTIVLGGLMREEDIKNMQKVPILGDIPLLGELFRKTKTQKTSSQVIITITPIVVQPSKS